MEKSLHKVTKNRCFEKLADAIKLINIRISVNETIKTHGAES